MYKKLNEYIWEFRTQFNGMAYRLLAFWDKDEMEQTLVIATHGINKKTKKTPKKEIDKAEDIRKQYLEYKHKTK
ncbi:hypothetical protein GCM10027566_00680 [Arachidicoccus ginsenosidivorans]